MHILIAEDDPVSTRILTAELRRLGHSLKTFPDGRSALHFFHVTRPDVIISDWMMPGMDGLKFCAEIRKADTPYYPYFILVTARSGEDDFREAMDAGVDDFLSKPVSIEQLQRRLLVAERIIRRQQTINPPANALCLCAGCQKVRHDDGRWEQIDAYLQREFHLSITHGVCGQCQDAGNDARNTNRI